jgi:hypothetical protein
MGTNDPKPCELFIRREARLGCLPKATSRACPPMSFGAQRGCSASKG